MLHEVDPFTEKGFIGKLPREVSKYTISFISKQIAKDSDFY